MQQMYHASDLASMDPLVLMKNLDHVRMTSRRLSYILQQQVHLYTPEANQLREQIDRYVEAERQIETELALAKELQRSMLPPGEAHDAAFGRYDVAAVLATNVTGVFNVTRAVVPYMTAQRSGTIVNLSSVSGEKGGRGQTNYAASKGAINAFTKALAVELAPRKIRVNCVAPGVIDTEMSAELREQAGDQVTSRILMRRYGTAEEVAYAVWFLASSCASYVTGQVWGIDGGFKME